MNLQPNTVLPAPSQATIEWFEDAYNVQLPSDFLQFLQVGNGGVPIENTFSHLGRGRVVEFFLCLLEDSAEDETNGWKDISVVLTDLDERLVDDEDLVGMNLIPVAALFGGDFVCLDFRNESSPPTVVVWDHEESEVMSPKVEKVADSFAEFLTLLRA